MVCGKELEILNFLMHCHFANKNIPIVCLKNKYCILYYTRKIQYFFTKKIITDIVISLIWILL